MNRELSPRPEEVVVAYDNIWRLKETTDQNVRDNAPAIRHIRRFDAARADTLSGAHSSARMHFVKRVIEEKQKALEYALENQDVLEPLARQEMEEEFRRRAETAS